MNGSFDDTTRSRVLHAAEAIVNGPRQLDYGPPEYSFAVIGELWSAILGEKVTPQQVALCLAGLKIARLTENDAHADSWIDLAGYAALGAELAGARIPKGGDLE